MRLTLALAGLACLGALGLLVWGPLPKDNRRALQILRARMAFGMLSVDTRYQLAERLFQEGEFERSLLFCQKALDRNPNHAPACALYTEVQFILGRGQATPSTPHYDRFMHGSVLVEIDHALLRAEGLRLAGDVEAATIEVRKVREYLKWMPSGGERDARNNEAQILSARLAKDGSTDD